MDPYWRILPTSAAPIEEELAGVDALLAGLRAGGPPTLRWYEAASTGLVLGAGQRISDVDSAAALALDVQVHKRASGGTAVLFAPGFLMQDIALPAAHPLHIGDVTESYRWLGEVWVAALATVGVDARLIAVAEARTDTQALGALERRACFGGRSPYEVLAGERKLVGFSQIRRREGAILQVGLYTHWSPTTLANLLALTPTERVALSAGLDRRVVGLAELLPQPLSLEQLAEAFAGALRARQVVLAPAPWTADELAAAAAARARYRSLPAS